MAAVAGVGFKALLGSWFILVWSCHLLLLPWAVSSRLERTQIGPKQKQFGLLRLPARVIPDRRNPSTTQDAILGTPKPCEDLALAVPQKSSKQRPSELFWGGLCPYIYGSGSKASGL